MANIKDRPYVGTWALNKRQIVQHTPDSLVYVNGSLSLPGCPKCKGKIPLQQFVTEISVEAGIDPGAASASFSLSVPLHSNESFARDAKHILKPGLEIHIYTRGYFPVKGLYNNLAEPRVVGINAVTGEGEIQQDISGSTVLTRQDAREVVPPKEPYTRQEMQAWADRLGVSLDILTAAIVQNSEAQAGQRDERAMVVHSLFNRMAYKTQKGKSTDVFEQATGGKSTLGAQTGRPYSSARVPMGELLNQRLDETLETVQERANNGSSDFNVYSFTHTAGQRAQRIRDPKNNRTPEDVHQKRITEDGMVDVTSNIFGSTRGSKAIEYYLHTYRFKGEIDQALIVSQAQAALAASETQRIVTPLVKTPETKSEETGDKPFSNAIVEPSLLARLGLSGLGVEDVLAYPYYHTFHGVVTNVTHSWSGGVNSISVQCASMLNFWQYHKIVTNANVINRQSGGGSGAQRGEYGHIYTGYHPYQIVWDVYHTMHKGGMQDSIRKSASNQNAVSSTTGDYLWHLTRDYWKARFSTGFNNLRMHGVTGELFSAAQAAALSQTSSKSLEQKIKKQLSGRAARQSNTKIDSPTGFNLADAKKLTLLAKSSEASEGVNINMAMIHPFVMDVTQAGAVAFWEAPYQSRLDIIQQVCEVTQFEFFQDVDGDFVFKPKMYNLDTSSSRIYRIEDIDIINISFDEKEPQATYAVVKNNTVVAGVEAGMAQEMSRIATYVDWRLIAQFGYRPLQFETSYVSDVKGMFYMAMNRLDALNATNKTASVTIPERPEIRPGYPVYIPYLDCFYYVSGLSHSFSVGGQCTTSLQLIARRAKFFAPGDPDKRGIDAIDFTKGSFPDRPLTVLDNMGMPKHAGFPNAVLALDPEQISPLYTPGGVFLNKIKTQEDQKNLLKIASRDGIGVIEEQPDGTYTFDVVAGLDEQGNPIKKTVRFFFQGDEKASDKSTGSAKDVPVENVDFGVAFKAYQKKSGSLAIGNKDVVLENTQKLRLELSIQRNKLKTAAKEAQAGILSGISKIEVALMKWEGALNTEEVDALIVDENLNSGIGFIMQLIDQIGDKLQISTDSKSARDTASAAYLDLLWDLKANFGGNGQPGNFRYYSCSHPEPKNQGQDLIVYNQPDEDAPTKIEKTPALLSARWAGVEVNGFLKAPSKPFDNSRGPEAELGPSKPVRGMYVYTTEGKETIPTSEVLTLMFTASHVKGKKKATTTTKTGAPTYKPGVRSDYFLIIDVPKDTKTPEELYIDHWNKTWVLVLKGMLNVKKFAATLVPAFKPFPSMALTSVFPASLKIGTTNVLTGSSLFDYAETETIRENSINGYRFEGITKLLSLTEAWAALGEALVFEFNLSLGDSISDWHGRLIKKSLEKDSILSKANADELLSFLVMTLGSSLGFKVKIRERTRETKAARHITDVKAPVFPVSDAQGFEVVGSMQYGRGLDIEPGGLLDALRSQDPLSVLDSRTVDLLVRAVIQGKTLYLEEDGSLLTREEYKNLPGGRKVKVKAQNKTQARNHLERKILEGLRRNFTDQQLLDLNLLSATQGEPNQFSFNLGNAFATSKDGVAKLPLVNAAYSLGDLTQQQGGHICGCKAAEAGVLLDAFGQEAFIQIGGAATTSKVETPGDEVSSWLHTEILKTAPSWKVRQDAYRGINNAHSGQTTLKSALSAAEALQQAASGEALAQTKSQEAFEQAKRNLAAVGTGPSKT